MRDREHFDRLVVDLQLSENQENVRQKTGRYRKWLTIFAVLLSLIIAYVGFHTYQGRDLSEKELVRYIHTLPVPEGEGNHPFTWTLESFVALPYGSKGASLSEVLNKHGKPVEVKPLPDMAADDGFEMSYIANQFDWSIPYQEVRLSFKKVNGVFRVFDKQGEDILGHQYKAKWDTVFNWKKDDLNTMDITTDLSDVSEEMTYQEIVKRHGPPNAVDYSISGRLETIFVRYYHAEADHWTDDDYVTLMFMGDLDSEDAQLMSYSWKFGDEKGEH